jgi:hypothetical protein
VILVWFPVVRKLSLLFDFNRLSRRAQTGQHRLDTPSVCLVVCIVKFNKDLSKKQKCDSLCILLVDLLINRHGVQ